MSRVERFRQIRTARQRYLLSALVFVFLLTAGICAADYSINGLMEGSSSLDVIQFKNNGYFFELAVMNQKIYVNTQYINRDLGRFKQGLEKLLGLK